MGSRKTPVLFLKTKSSPTDAYEDYFANASNGAYDPRFVPVLDHRFTEHGTESLQDSIEQGAFLDEKQKTNVTPYGGLIFTSQRAVEAFTWVLENLRLQDTSVMEYFPQDMPIYVVGPATARGLNALNLPCSIIGEETGNGDVLAEFILEHYNGLHIRPLDTSASLSSSRPLKPGLLFPVGEKRRDIIFRALQSELLPAERRIKVTELTVYETAVMQSFESQFAKEIQPAFQENRPQWIIVFSPTGCKAMLEGLDLLDPQTGKAKGKSTKGIRKTLIATIGPTTRDYLIREFDLEPDVCSSKPSPEGLGASIAGFDRPP